MEDTKGTKFDSYPRGTKEQVANEWSQCTCINAENLWDWDGWEAKMWSGWPEFSWVWTKTYNTRHPYKVCYTAQLSWHTDFLFERLLLILGWKDLR